jgi:hypothetical protein
VRMDREEEEPPKESEEENKIGFYCYYKIL